MNGVMRQVPCSSPLFLVNKRWLRLSGMSANLSAPFLSHRLVFLPTNHTKFPGLAFTYVASWLLLHNVWELRGCFGCLWSSSLHRQNARIFLSGCGLFMPLSLCFMGNNKRCLFIFRYMSSHQIFHNSVTLGREGRPQSVSDRQVRHNINKGKIW